MLISLSRPWACRWINNLSLWHMASATPDLRLPSQLQGIAAPWLVPKFTAEGHVCEQLAQGCYLKMERPGVEPVTFCFASQHPNHYTTRPQQHIKTQKINATQQLCYAMINKKGLFTSVFCLSSANACSAASACFCRFITCCRSLFVSAWITSNRASASSFSLRKYLPVNHLTSSCR